VNAIDAAAAAAIARWVLVNMVSLVDERNARATNSESDRAIRRNEGGADYVLAM
jgi:hypothetical protein